MEIPSHLNSSIAFWRGGFPLLFTTICWEKKTRRDEIGQDGPYDFHPFRRSQLVVFFLLRLASSMPG